MLRDCARGYKAVGAGVLRIGAAGKTTFPKVLSQDVVIVLTIRQTSKYDDISNVVGFVGCEIRIVVSSFLMVPRSTITLCLDKK